MFFCSKIEPTRTRVRRCVDRRAHALSQKSTLMGCAFTDAASTHDGTCVSDCRRCAKPFTMVGCTFCKPGQYLERCSNCYNKFDRSGSRRVMEIESSEKGGKVYMTWALRGLFAIDWRALGRNPCDLEAAHAAEFLELVDGKLRWRQRCPSCYTFNVPGIAPSMPTNFAELDPTVADQFIVDFDARHLAIPSGLIADSRKPVRVDVVLLKPVLTYDESRGIQFRTADPPEHDNYLGFWKPPAGDGR